MVKDIPEETIRNDTHINTCPDQLWAGVIPPVLYKSNEYV
jgi:hypothetical protein